MTYGIGIETMMKHFTITLAFLMMLDSQANADTYKVGDTFYCSSEDGAFVQASGDWRRPSRLAFQNFQP